ncbi:hypothetical protein ACRALDRAFT_205947, partial [Sodiomyces alcalophilus JCM 7366]|uniref:uncharacterized protein n=1 Tax=Sodiomyces alcalophilus JCM 7366 TaxID=591952 RepID=UPI0039B5CFCA
ALRSLPRISPRNPLPRIPPSMQIEPFSTGPAPLKSAKSRAAVRIEQTQGLAYLGDFTATGMQFERVRREWVVEECHGTFSFSHEIVDGSMRECKLTTSIATSTEPMVLCSRERQFANSLRSMGKGREEHEEKEKNDIDEVEDDRMKIYVLKGLSTHMSMSPTPHPLARTLKYTIVLWVVPWVTSSFDGSFPTVLVGRHYSDWEEHVI